MRLPRSQEKGFSLIEILLSLALSVTVLALIKNPLMQTLNLDKVVKDRNVLQNLEDRLRQSVIQNASFEIALAASPPLSACVKQDGKPCLGGRQPLSLFIAKDKRTTGLFAARGEACSGGACPISIEAYFSGICAIGSSGVAEPGCELAPTLEIEYKLSVGGAIFRRGLIYRANSNLVLADENATCEVDELGRSHFAHAISPQKIACLPPPRHERKLSGIQLGDCPGINDILVGFAPGGQRICAPIRRKQP